jgi:hypothetical protein
VFMARPSHVLPRFFRLFRACKTRTVTATEKSEGLAA